MVASTFPVCSLLVRLTHNSWENLGPLWRTQVLLLPLAEVEFRYRWIQLGWGTAWGQNWINFHSLCCFPCRHSTSGYGHAQRLECQAGKKILRWCLTMLFQCQLEIGMLWFPMAQRDGILWQYLILTLSPAGKINILAWFFQISDIAVFGKYM